MAASRAALTVHGSASALWVQPRFVSPLLQPHSHGRSKRGEARQDRGTNLVGQSLQVDALAVL